MPVEESGSTIGVVVVAFNAADVIAECLDSLLALEGSKVRIVVVDNASTDHTLAVLPILPRTQGAKPLMPQSPV